MECTECRNAMWRQGIYQLRLPGQPYSALRHSSSVFRKFRTHVCLLVSGRSVCAPVFILRVCQFVKMCVHRVLLGSSRCQYYVFRWGTWLPALQGVITFFVLANFTLATFMDPGVIPKGMFIYESKYYQRDSWNIVFEKEQSFLKHLLMRIEKMIYMLHYTKM